jgi:Rrf2 family cysteine metabolism transcriptional repressor
MRLSRKSEYACLALIDLSEHYEGEYVKIREVAERKQIPRGFLVQILLRLKAAGYVRSARGSAGGYKLAKPPKRITLAEVIRLMDGALAPVESVSELFYETTPIERHPKLLRFFREIRDYVARALEQTTFADIT